jgi:pentatricopeptide repeat protein
MVLPDEMHAKGCEPDIVTYNVLINSLPSYGCKPRGLNILCSSERWEEAEKLLTKMFSNSCARMRSHSTQ